MSSSQVGSSPPRGERAGGNALGAAEGARPARRSARPVLRVATHLLNPVILQLAGSRYLPFFAVVHHRGRRSGRRYATPVAARRTPDGFVIALTFGEGADWFRNVQAAGGCVIRWKGADYPVVAPEVVDRATARSAFSPIERLLLPLIGIERVVRLRFAPVNEELRRPAALSGSPSHDTLVGG